MIGNGRKLSALDLLALPIAPHGGIRQDTDGFHVDEPWAVADFGALSLKAGWWRIDCKGKDIGFPELRLSAPWDPLITVRIEQGSGARIYLRKGDYRVSLLASAWPGQRQFERLAFQRLGILAQAHLMAAGLARLSRRERPFEILARALRRLLAGQSIGVRSGTSLVKDPPAAPPPVAVASSRRIVEKDGMAVILEVDDRLHNDAFAIAGAEFARRPSLEVLFSDADEIGHITPHPQWDADLARAFSFGDAPIFLRASAARGDVSLSQLVDRHGASAIGRVPLPLVSRKSARTQFPKVIPVPTLAIIPRVSVIIPTKTRIDLLKLCLHSLRNQTGYANLQIVIVDNGATDPEFPSLLKDAAEVFDLIKVEDFGVFNFSRLINAGVARSDGQILLLLNDDVEAQELGWLERMVDSAMRPEVGAVGARLTYADGSIQHAGVALGLGGVCGHLWKGMSREAAATNPYVSLPGRRLAVTAACLAVRRCVFDEAGGFDEALGVALNDIDFCLRLHAKGYANTYRGDAWLVHHESQSRGLDDATLAKRKRLLEEAAVFLGRWSGLIGSDPFSSPAFDVATESGAVHSAAWGRPQDYRDV